MWRQGEQFRSWDESRLNSITLTVPGSKHVPGRSEHMPGRREHVPGRREHTFQSLDDWAWTQEKMEITVRGVGGGFSPSAQFCGGLTAGGFLWRAWKTLLISTNTSDSVGVSWSTDTFLRCHCSAVLSHGCCGLLCDGQVYISKTRITVRLGLRVGEIFFKCFLRWPHFTCVMQSSG